MIHEVNRMKKRKGMAKGIKKAGLLGLGLALMTKDQIMNYAKELKKRAEMDAKQGKKLAKDLMKQSKEEKDKLEKMIKKNVKEYVGKAGIATKSDIKKLEKKINALKKTKTNKAKKKTGKN